MKKYENLQEYSVAYCPTPSIPFQTICISEKDTEQLENEYKALQFLELFQKAHILTTEQEEKLRELIREDQTETFFYSEGDDYFIKLRKKEK